MYLTNAAESWIFAKKILQAIERRHGVLTYAQYRKSISTNLLKQPLVNVGGNKCWDKVKSVLIVQLPFQPKFLCTVQKLSKFTSGFCLGIFRNHPL